MDVTGFAHVVVIATICNAKVKHAIMGVTVVNDIFVMSTTLCLLT
jgi:hypothetical protein